MDTNDVQVLIDVAAAAETPEEDAVREWLAGQRVFVSSVMDGMEAERQAVAEAVRKVGAKPVLFEEFGGRDDDPSGAYIAEVASSDIYVGILGRKYGRLLPSRFSATHTEYREAEDRGLRICAWTAASGDLEGHQQSFLDDLRVFYVVPPHTSPDDLGKQVERRLREIAAEELSPWVKLDQAVFRARSVEDRGSSVVIDAVVKDREVVAHLTGLRPDQWGRGQPVWLSWPGEVRKVEIEDILITTRATRAVQVRITASRSESQSDRDLGWTEVSTAGYTPDDLSELALKVTLFGEENPLGMQGFLAEMPDPYEPLRRTTVAEEALRPIAKLLLHEALVRTGRGERVTTFRLGARVDGYRHHVVGWMPKRRYDNEDPVGRTVEGKVRL